MASRFHFSKLSRVVICACSIIIMIIGCLLLISSTRIKQVYGNCTFDQILFHLSLPWGTLNPGEIHRMTRIKGRYETQFVLLCLFAYCLSMVLMLNNVFYEWVKSKISCPLVYSFLLSVVVFSIGFWQFDRNFHVIRSIVQLREKSQLIDENYVENVLQDFRQVSASGKSLSKYEKPNLILIVSESLEQTFADSEICGDNLIPELEAFQKEGDCCRDFHSVYGCSYTIASLYAMQYGLPSIYLAAKSGRPLQENIFKKNCISLFDILHHGGYRLEYLQAASLKFANKEMLFKHIPGTLMLGNDEVSLDEYPERGGWGLWDRDLFDKAKKEVSLLAAGKDPFCLHLLTVDAHSGNHLLPGAISKYEGESRNIIGLQSKLISDFVAWIRKQPYAENTVIAIVGDHVMMTDILDGIKIAREKRRIFNCILNSKSNMPMRADRSAAMFDYGPTLLSALGFVWPSGGLGIGRSLYCDEKTILEKYGKAFYEQEMYKRSPKYMSLVFD